MSEYRLGGFQILPPVIKNLIIINVLVFAATYVFRKAGIIDLDYYLALFHWRSPFFKPWQLVTHLFMHGNLTHLLFNMFALWMFGNLIENTLGAKRFLIFYFVCGLGAAICHMLVFSWENVSAINWYAHLSDPDKQTIMTQFINSNRESVYAPAAPMFIPMLGASGAIFGVLFAFGYLFPNMMIYISFIFPLKAKYFVAIYAVIELFSGFRNSPVDQVAHFAHLGGMLFAFLLLRAWKLSSRNMWRY
ncbi:rhomboid family intramembrane serine protease [Taibaiella koreensis]|uniref:rhomboid family intramembrane serine protease n=1 Tax=Taibaiella koreensis TaxID=1268548 RepID=UPI000E59FE8D|nr:rhomboid family intramembrane serine protease [Taibaiella koreensis]